MFHPLIWDAVVFRRCKLDRILKLGDKTWISLKPAITVQMDVNFHHYSGFSRMEKSVILNNPQS